MTPQEPRPPEPPEEPPAPPSEVEAGRALPEPFASGAGLLVAVVGAGLITLLIGSLDETYEAVVEGDGVARIDQPLLDWMVQHRSPGLDTVVTAFTNVGGPVLLPIVVTLVVIALGVWWRSWTPVVLMVVAAAGSLAMTQAGKDLTDRARPPLALAVPPYESSPSFPSGHALNSTVVAMVLGYLVLTHVHSRLGRTLTVVGLALYAVLMGLSRVYLGHHWFTDVVAGFFAGAAWAIVVILAHRLVVWLQRRRALRSAPSAAVRPRSRG